MQVSVILTIGSALRRAEQYESEVTVLVQGEWLRGRVRGVDGHGVILDDGQGHDLVVRLEEIAVLRIDQEEPWSSEDAHAQASALHDDAAFRSGSAGQLDVPRPRAAEASI